MDVIPDISPLPKKPGFYAKLLYPQEIGNDKLMAISESSCCSMLDTGVYKHTVGPTWTLKPYDTIRQTITDPRQRLAELVQNSKRFNFLIELNARYSLQILMGERQIAWELLDEDFNHCGLSVFYVPENMIEEKNRRLGINTIWFKIYRYYCNLKFKIWIIFNKYLCNYDPLSNTRMAEFQNRRKEQFPNFLNYNEERRKELWQMDKNQLSNSNELYTVQDTLQLALFTIDKQHQRKGLGTAFLKHTLDQIPIKTQFNNGPQKVMLIATELGIPLYKKFGFSLTYRYQYTDKDGICIETSRMDMTR